MIFKRMFRKMLLLAVMLTAGASCTSDFTYSSYPCYLVIDNSMHMDETLSTAMNSMSPGVFCLVTLNARSDGFIFSNNQGLKSEKKFNGVDQRLSHHLGMNNGLIVGFGNLSDGRFFAYDRECPECFNAHGDRLVSRHLEMRSTGIAYCPVCKNEYDMNNGGNCLTSKEKDQKGLTAYRCSTTGPYGRLQVGN